MSRMITRKPMGSSPDDAPGPFDHGPLGIERIRPSEQGPGFVRMLQANGKVIPVSETWTPRDDLPPGIEWVLFPNGDLARVGSP